MKNDIFRFNVAFNTDLIYPIIPFIELAGEICLLEVIKETPDDPLTPGENEHHDFNNTPDYIEKGLPDDFLFLIIGIRGEFTKNLIIDLAYQQPISPDALEVYRAIVSFGVRIEF